MTEFNLSPKYNNAAARVTGSRIIHTPEDAIMYMITGTLPSQFPSFVNINESFRDAFMYLAVSNANKDTILKTLVTYISQCKDLDSNEDQMVAEVSAIISFALGYENLAKEILARTNPIRKSSVIESVVTAMIRYRMQPSQLIESLKDSYEIAKEQLTNA